MGSDDENIDLQRTAGSVHVDKTNLRRTTFLDSYVTKIIEERKTELAGSNDNLQGDINIHVHVDKNAASQRMRALFKRTFKEEGLVNTIMLFISLPLTFIRDYTIPIGELAAWNR